MLLSTDLHALSEESAVPSVNKVEVLKEAISKNITAKSKRNTKAKDSPPKTSKDKEPSPEKKGKCCTNAFAMVVMRGYGN